MSQEETTTREERKEVKVPSTDSVTFLVTDVREAEGFGLHISSTQKTDGWGGRWAECHFLAGTLEKPNNNLRFLCFDGYVDDGNAQNGFRVSLGPKANILQIELTLRPTRVDLEAILLSRNGTNSKRYTFPLSTTIPVREDTGFWRSGRLHYSVLGVLNGRSGRRGKGYVVQPPTVRSAFFGRHDPLCGIPPGTNEPKDNRTPIT